ncbi:Flp pilus assembly protein CpaB [Geomonas sp. Red32]|uniref:Flp pilus assembly protein CpaB n=1 Tax=Geomonas sp. Red32 TaxID=2912856 RepID=UPI00202CE05C|nr:Flp pilus assembly protein CpaB [Geomonas sp. Red32]MCM0082880.1 Flp pilus assembly protein CpaB [Geomonas sp. Red32]
MTRPNSVVIIVSASAVVFAGAAAWLTYNYLQQEVSSVKAVQPQKIVVAKSDIPIGTPLKQAQLKVTSWPKDSIPPGSAQTPEPLVGRVAIRPIAGGDAVTEQKLKPKAGAQGSGFMTYVVPPGHRAVTVAVNEVAGVAGFLTPNDRVDIVVTAPLPDNDKESVSKIILENVPILATGQITDQREGKPVVVPTVTMDLIPADAEKLVLSASKGSLQLLLRNIADSGTVDSKGATIAKVLGGAERALVASPPATASKPGAKPGKQVRVVKSTSPGYTLEVVKGTEKTSWHYTE